MSKTSWIALLLALGLALCGCKSDGDDDDAAGDDDATGDDDTSEGDDDDVDDDDDDYVGDDDDVDFWNQVDTFEPTTIVLGETPPFTATGIFCADTEVYFSDSTSLERLYVQHYTSCEYHRIEGTIPEGLWVGIFDVVADCAWGATGWLGAGLEVVEDGLGDDDDSAGDDDDPA